MPAPRLVACHCCGLIQELSVEASTARAECARCGVTVWHPGRRARSRRRVLAAASAGLILYPLAISLPIMRLERFGSLSEASIWSGSLGLLQGNQFLVGLLVFLCSIVLPLLKLVGLLAISSRRLALSAHHRSFTYRVIEWTGRWGMLDVLLIAVTVAWVKLGNVVEVSAGPAAFVFTACVLCSLLASAWFDPHALWEPPGTGGSAGEGAA